jgi:hypothetical protein
LILALLQVGGTAFVLRCIYPDLTTASSVDAERAFSVGRLEVNHLQQNTSPQTFKAQIAVGSWARTPLYPGLSETVKIVERQMVRESQTRAGEGEEVDEVEVELELEDEGDLSDDERRFFAE